MNIVITIFHYITDSICLDRKFYIHGAFSDLLASPPLDTGLHRRATRLTDHQKYGERTLDMYNTSIHYVLW